MITFSLQLSYIQERRSFPFDSEESYIQAIRNAALSILDLPQKEILRKIRHYEDDVPLLECIAFIISTSNVDYYGTDEWIALLKILPYLLNSEVCLDPDTGQVVTASNTLGWALKEDILYELMKWDHPKAIAAREPLERKK